MKNAYVGPHLHPAVADHPPAGHPAQAQPAEGGDPRQAADRRRRLDRAGQHPARADPDAPRGRGGRGARAHRVPAGEVAVLLRHRLRVPGRTDRQRRQRRRPQDEMLEAVRHAIGADTLGYISLQGMVAATEQPATRLCWRASTVNTRSNCPARQCWAKTSSNRCWRTPRATASRCKPRTTTCRRCAGPSAKCSPGRRVARRRRARSRGRAGIRRSTHPGCASPSPAGISPRVARRPSAQRCRCPAPRAVPGTRARPSRRDDRQSADCAPEQLMGSPWPGEPISTPWQLPHTTCSPARQSSRTPILRSSSVATSTPILHHFRNPNPNFRPLTPCSPRPWRRIRRTALPAAPTSLKRSANKSPRPPRQPRHQLHRPLPLRNSRRARRRHQGSQPLRQRTNPEPRNRR